MADENVKLVGTNSVVDVATMSYVYAQTHLMARAFGRLYLRDMSQQAGKFVYNYWPTVAPYIRICPFRAFVLVSGILSLSRSSENRVVEFGVSGGGSFALMCLAAREFGIDAKFIGYDTFLGLPTPHTEHDRGYREGQFAATEQSVAGLLASLGIHRDRYELVAGDIRASQILRNDENIDLVHLDMDLYEPTLFALRHLKRHSARATLILDDVFDDSGGVLFSAREEDLSLHAGPTGQAIAHSANMNTHGLWEAYRLFLSDCRTAISPNNRGHIDNLTEKMNVTKRSYSDE